MTSSPMVQAFRSNLGSALRALAILLIALLGFGLVLLLFGKNPIQAYVDIFKSTLGNSYGLSEVLVKMIPLVLTAFAVLLPARIGLVNVGGEGQLYIGATLATWGALKFSYLPAYLLLPLVVVLGFIGGGLWALIPAILRAKGWLNEVISTLLLNYVAIAFVNLLIFGQWRDPAGGNTAQTPTFVDAARLPRLGDTRVHYGLLIAAAVVLIVWFVISRTRWGYDMRAIGGNPEAARRHGLSIVMYIVVIMFIAGGLAGLAGMGEVMAIQGRLRQGISPGYGYIGFLISWLALHNPLVAVLMAFLLSVIALGGDTLQLTQSVPFATVNILMSLVLFIVLARIFPKRTRTAR